MDIIRGLEMSLVKGDLVKYMEDGWRTSEHKLLGVVLRILNSNINPCLVEVMWSDGDIKQAWEDELEVSNE